MPIDIRKMEGALKELHAIVFSDDGFHTPIENTILYQAVQNADCLSVNGLDIYADSLNCPPEVLLLIAKIAATSPTLHTVNMRFINIAEYGPDIATALATSDSIVNVNMSCNNLAEHGPDTAAALATSDSIINVSITGNDLAEHGPATAAALANSNSIAKVNMSGNDLAEHGPATVASLTNSNSIHFITIRANNLGSHTTATQDVLNTYNDNLNTLLECLHDLNVLPLQEDHLATLVCQYVDTNIEFDL